MTTQKKRSTQKQQQLMEKILSDPQYKGKHVIVVAGEIFTANTEDGAGKILDTIQEKYPDEVPAITYIPDADTLILSSY